MSAFFLIWTEFSDIVGKFRFHYVRKKIFGDSQRGRWRMILQLTMIFLLMMLKLL